MCYRHGGRYVAMCGNIYLEYAIWYDIYRESNMMQFIILCDKMFALTINKQIKK